MDWRQRNPSDCADGVRLSEVPVVPSSYSRPRTVAAPRSSIGQVQVYKNVYQLSSRVHQSSFLNQKRKKKKRTESIQNMSDDAALLMMAKVLEAQKPKAHELKDAPAFYRNMETVLDKRRMDQTMLTLLPARPVVDFSSCDILSLSKQVHVHFSIFPFFEGGRSIRRKVEMVH